VWDLNSSDIANVPDSFPRMKYCVCTTHWVVYEEDVDGPYLSESDARESIND